jgi:hypothetical protein
MAAAAPAAAAAAAAAVQVNGRPLTAVVLDRLSDLKVELAQKQFPYRDPFEAQAANLERHLQAVHAMHSALLDATLKVQQETARESRQLLSDLIARKPTAAKLPLWRLCSLCCLVLTPTSTVRDTLQAMHTFLSKPAKDAVSDYEQSMLRSIVDPMRKQYQYYQDLITTKLSVMFAAAVASGDQTTARDLATLTWSQLFDNRFLQLMGNDDRPRMCDVASRLFDHVTLSSTASNQLETTPRFVIAATRPPEELRSFVDEFFVSCTATAMVRSLAFRCISELPQCDSLSSTYKDFYKDRIDGCLFNLRAIRAFATDGLRSPLGDDMYSGLTTFLSRAIKRIDDQNAAPIAARPFQQWYVPHAQASAAAAVALPDLEAVDGANDDERVIIDRESAMYLACQTIAIAAKVMNERFVDVAQSLTIASAKGWMSPFWCASSRAKAAMQGEFTKHLHVLRGMLTSLDHGVKQAFLDTQQSPLLADKAVKAANDFLQKVVPFVNERANRDSAVAFLTALHAHLAALQAATTNADVLRIGQLHIGVGVPDDIRVATDEVVQIWTRYTRARVAIQYHILEAYENELKAIVDRLEPALEAFRTVVYYDYESTFCLRSIVSMRTHDRWSRLVNERVFESYAELLAHRPESLIVLGQQLAAIRPRGNDNKAFFDDAGAAAAATIWGAAATALDPRIMTFGTVKTPDAKRGVQMSVSPFVMSTLPDKRKYLQQLVAHIKSRLPRWHPPSSWNPPAPAAAAADAKASVILTSQLVSVSGAFKAGLQMSGLLYINSALNQFRATSLLEPGRAPTPTQWLQTVFYYVTFVLEAFILHP